MSGRLRRRLLGVVSATTLSAGLLFLVTDGYLRVKAAVASVLIERSLQRHLADGGAHPPWPWADMHPVARLEVPRLEVRQPVLEGASGESMAFGIGHVVGSAPPNAAGGCVLAGHRSSSMTWLDEVDIGDAVLVQTGDGTTAYRVVEMAVVDYRDGWILDPAGEQRLILVTCYPIGGILPGDDRYVVVAEPDRPDVIESQVRFSSYR